VLLDRRMVCRLAVAHSLQVVRSVLSRVIPCDKPKTRVKEARRSSRIDRSWSPCQETMREGDGWVDWSGLATLLAGVGRGFAVSFGLTRAAGENPHPLVATL